MNEEEILQFEERVNRLMAWKNNRENDRFVLPMDVVSKKTLSYWVTQNFNGLPIFTGKIIPASDVDRTDLLLYGLEVSINNAKRVVLIQLGLKGYTVNATSDVFTNTNGNHNLSNGD